MLTTIVNLFYHAFHLLRGRTAIEPVSNVAKNGLNICRSHNIGRRHHAFVVAPPNTLLLMSFAAKEGRMTRVSEYRNRA